MSTNCEILSAAAQKVFDQMQPHFPPDPWGNPCWASGGHVLHNGKWHDLKLAADRSALEAIYKSFIGYSVQLKAHSYRDEWGMNDFEKEPIGEMIKREAEFLLLLDDLDFQIETADLCDEDVSEIIEENQANSKRKRERD